MINSSDIIGQAALESRSNKSYSVTYINSDRVDQMILMYDILRELRTIRLFMENER